MYFALNASTGSRRRQDRVAYQRRSGSIYSVRALPTILGDIRDAVSQRQLRAFILNHAEHAVARALREIVQVQHATGQ